MGFENLLGYLEGGIDVWIKAGKLIEKIEFVETKDLPKIMRSMPIVDVRK